MSGEQSEGPEKIPAPKKGVWEIEAPVLPMLLVVVALLLWIATHRQRRESPPSVVEQLDALDRRLIRVEARTAA